jgi:hypothetical protein
MALERLVLTERLDRKNMDAVYPAFDKWLFLL